MKKAFNTSLFLLLSMFLVQCAQQGSLSGGEKDIHPPAVYDSLCLPNNYSTSFSGRLIVLEFDEYFRLDNPNGQILISPPLANSPEYRVRNKSLEILLSEDLSENTTYVINFGSAIQDITESNTTEDFKFVFSTGTVIDSLSWNGFVQNSQTGQPEPDIWVMLYDGQADSLPYTTLPRYLAKSNKQGMFDMRFLAAGNYKAFALKDENNNYLYDLPSESIAYIDSLIPIGNENKPTVFSLFTEQKEALFLTTKTFVAPGKLTFIFNQRTEGVTVKSLNGDPFQFSSKHTSLEKDTLIYWLPPNSPDTLELLLEQDTAFADTLFLVKRYNYTDAKRTKPKPLVLTVTSNIKGKLNPYQPVTLQFNYPVDSIDLSKVELTADSNATAFTIVPFDSLGLKWQLQSDWQTELAYAFNFYPNAASSPYGVLNQDTLQYSFSVERESHFAQVVLDVQLPKAPTVYYLSLLNSTGQVVRKSRLTKSDQLKYTNLLPGKYSLRLHRDDNQNGVWDTGSYDDLLQPEKIIYMQTQIELRSNWDLKESWIVPNF